ncbi:Extensin-like protein [Quillaja saponaria]|uniref:Extensin-like protein n=1 Tax=Quillaja saponaria TaxID=32244 RepID=A0AAD7PS67_QUISA|nr:Extensin-like protein [Quillaja saponaria]
MAVDESFKKPGAVPFKWEVKPGIPKLEEQLSDKLHRSLSQTLRPPPASTGSHYYFPPTMSQSRSLRSKSQIRSDRWRFVLPNKTRPDPVSHNPSGCFISSLLGILLNKKMQRRMPKPDYTSDLETPTRWSVSSRKSVSSSSSSHSSNQLSHRPVNYAE